MVCDVCLQAFGYLAHSVQLDYMAVGAAVGVAEVSSGDTAVDQDQVAQNEIAAMRKTSMVSMAWLPAP